MRSNQQPRNVFKSLQFSFTNGTKMNPEAHEPQNCGPVNPGEEEEGVWGYSHMHCPVTVNTDTV
uniref:Uncharacterized protein n=1 Tax=Anguilla anguilla TaxID=7936 RepID=A0A0E9X189_ANGAN